MEAVEVWPETDMRTPIKGGEWVISIQLEVDEKPKGEPLVLRYADTRVCGLPKKAACHPQDFGYLLSRALFERALKLSSRKKK